MRNRPLCFVLNCLRSARVPRAVFGVAPKQSLKKFAIANRDRQQQRRLRPPELHRPILLFLLGLGIASMLRAQDSRSTTADSDQLPEAEPVVVSATRFDIPLDQSPASVSVIDSQDIENKQTERVADALREVPGLNVVQTGTAGQLTSVFMRGLPSQDMQVLLDGIPINQGLAGQFDFANLTTDNIDRIEIARGPQSTIYGPRALAGVVQIFTRQGSGSPEATLSEEGGTYDTFRETLASEGKVGDFDYSLGASRLDTDNARPNNTYRNTSGIADIGLSPNEQLRIGSLFVYSESETGNPNSIFNFHPVDHFLTEKWFIAPHVDLRIGDWWEHKLIFDYDEERQVNNPNFDGFVPGTIFVGPTRALFTRATVDYQNDLHATSWLTVTSGFFYNWVRAGQERPFILQIFGPQPRFISDHTDETAGFLQTTLTPIQNLIFVAGGSIDSFNDFGDVWTYRVAGSYKIDKTDTTLHASVATGFSPPSSQDKIFRFNPNPSQPLPALQPEKDFGWDVGFEQRFWERRITVGATYFHNDLSNVIGFNGLFETLNLGAAETQGVETELRATPIANLDLRASYTYLEAKKTSSADIGAPQGSRLPRRPRNEVYLSASYLWCHKLRTTVEAKWVNAREEINPNFFGPNIDIEDYNFVNVAAEYEINPHMSIFGRVDNVTGEHYAEVFGFPALGTAAYAGMKLRF